MLTHKKNIFSKLLTERKVFYIFKPSLLKLLLVVKNCKKLRPGGDFRLEKGQGIVLKHNCLVEAFASAGCAPNAFWGWNGSSAGKESAGGAAGGG